MQERPDLEAKNYEIMEQSFEFTPMIFGDSMQKERFC